jgi:hypothetical protein
MLKYLYVETHIIFHVIVSLTWLKYVVRAANKKENTHNSLHYNVYPLSVIWKALCNEQEFLDKTRDALFAPNHSIIICRLAEIIIQKLYS